MKDGITHNYLRFIAILTPVNDFLERVCDGSERLGYISQLSLITLGEDEELLIDSGDFTSCFSLFRRPVPWMR